MLVAMGDIFPATLLNRAIAGTFFLWLLVSYLAPLVMAVVVARFRSWWPESMGTAILGLSVLNTALLFVFWSFFMLLAPAGPRIVGLLVAAVHVWAWIFVAKRLTNRFEERVFSNV